MTRTGIVIVLTWSLSVAVAPVGAGDQAVASPEATSGPDETGRRAVETADEVARQLKSGTLNREIVRKQAAIVRDLKRLLEASQVTSPQMPLPAPQPGSSSEASKGNGASAPGPAGGERREDDDRSAESTRTEAGSTEGPAVPVSPRDLADAVWGHLPPRERDELIRTFNERYLPKYDAWVRRYFEALAEQP